MQQYDPQNIFAKILRGDLPCHKVYEDKYTLAFYDIHPAAPLHVLIIPKGPYISFHDFAQNSGAEAIGRFFQTVQNIATSLDLGESGYRLITNHGANAVQTVSHFHVHILGKKSLGPLVLGDQYHLSSVNTVSLK